MYTLHAHQVRVLSKIKTVIAEGSGKAKGRIVIPTGGGKTFIEAAVIENQRSQCSVKTRLHLVLAPRIVLANQLIGEFRKFSGNTYRSIAFHSGEYEPDYDAEDGITWKESSTTSVEMVEEVYVSANNSGQDLIVFSTYHSSKKLTGFEFDVMIADESQYCVNENFNDVIKLLSANIKLFFTATERHTKSDKGRGLNNEDVYGGLIDKIHPAELIELGLIVPPRLHVMYSNSNDKDRTVVSEVIELAHAQTGITPTKIGFTKILFAMKSTDDVKTIEDNIDKIHQAFPGFDVLTITSKNGARINGNVVNRYLTFMPVLNEDKNTLIFHYDILSEGIDVGGITGVVLMRNMKKAKLLQTIGRAVRVYRPDPGAKPWALISVSVVNGDEDSKANVKEYIEAIRDAGYDISAEEVVETGDPRGIADEQQVGDAVTDDKNNFSSLFITNIFHELEEDEFWQKLGAADTDEDFINLLIND